MFLLLNYKIACMYTSRVMIGCITSSTACSLIYFFQDKPLGETIVIIYETHDMKHERGAVVSALFEAVFRVSYIHH